MDLVELRTVCFFFAARMSLMCQQCCANNSLLHTESSEHGALPTRFRQKIQQDSPAAPVCALLLRNDARLGRARPAALTLRRSHARKLAPVRGLGLGRFTDRITCS